MMTTQETNNITVWGDDEKIEEIRKLFAPKLTEMEFKFFVGLGKATKLNPFVKEIWAVKYDERSPAQIFIGRDGYRKAAQNHPEYDYHQCDAVYTNDEFYVKDGKIEHRYHLKDRGELIGAYCIAKRRRSTLPIYVFAELKEYSTGKSLWNPTSGKPATMIKKVAESQCLRAAFQDLLGGTYGEEEIPETIQFQQANSLSKSNSLLQKVYDARFKHSDSEQIEDINPKMKENLKKIKMLLDAKSISEDDVKKAIDFYHIQSLSELTYEQSVHFIRHLTKFKNKHSK